MDEKDPLLKVSCFPHSLDAEESSNLVETASRAKQQPPAISVDNFEEEKLEGTTSMSKR